MVSFFFEVKRIQSQTNENYLVQDIGILLQPWIHEIQKYKKQFFIIFHFRGTVPKQMDPIVLFWQLLKLNFLLIKNYNVSPTNV